MRPIEEEEMPLPPLLLLLFAGGDPPRIMCERWARTVSTFASANTRRAPNELAVLVVVVGTGGKKEGEYCKKLMDRQIVRKVLMFWSYHEENLAIY
jgi:hypothetical protein